MSCTLPPILDSNLKLLLIGQNPAPKSCKNGVYFTSNTTFWKLLCESEMTNEAFLREKFEVGDDRKLLSSEEIGITDLVHTAGEFSRGMFTKEERSRLDKEIEESNPTVIGFIGIKAYRIFKRIGRGTDVHYGPQQEQYKDRHMFVLPFPTYAMNHEHKIVMYNDLARIVKDIELYRIPGRSPLINSGCDSSICAKCLGGNCTNVYCKVHPLDKKYRFRLRVGSIRRCEDWSFRTKCK